MELFGTDTPKTEDWAKVRKVFGNDYYEEEEEHEADSTKEQWFNYPVLALYVRN